MLHSVSLCSALCKHEASPFVLPVMTTLNGGVSSLVCRRAAGGLTLVWDRAVQAGLCGRGALQEAPGSALTPLRSAHGAALGGSKCAR